MPCSVYFMLFIILLVTTNTIADQCIGQVCIPENYTNTVLPFQNQTNNIQFDFEEVRILKVNDHEYIITLSLLLNMRWIEPRLKLISRDKRRVVNNISVIDLPKDLIWMPDIHIYDFHSIKNRGSEYINLQKLYLLNESSIYYTTDMEIDN